MWRERSRCDAHSPEESGQWGCDDDDGDEGKLTFAVNQDASVAAIGTEKHGFFVGETSHFGGGGTLGGVRDAFEELVDTLVEV